MKKLLLVVFVGLASVAWGQQSQPINISGNAFLDVCESENPEDVMLQCQLYVAGVIDGLGFANVPAFCAPEAVTYGQGFRLAVKYIHEHPEQLHYPTSLLIVLAEAKAFPCPVATAATKKPAK